MDHLEMVEKLREKANVSYEEAKTALEAANWDLLDAMVLLESEGKIHTDSTSNFTTKQPEKKVSAPDQSGRGMVRRLCDTLVSLINKANTIDLEVSRRSSPVFTVPLIALLLLLIFAFWFTIPIIVISLFFGYRYTFKGPNVMDSINQAMEKAADAADSIRSGVTKEESGKNE